MDVERGAIEPVCNFAAWVARADYRLPVEIFTVNYDLLLETAFETLNVPYFDGFVGTLRAKFHAELVENLSKSDGMHIPAFFARLWKLHGSVNWAWDDKRHIVRFGGAVADGRAAAIYPSDAKYDESRRFPFVVLLDHLRRSLQQPETIIIIIGYSFGDAHLNEILFEAATHRQRSEFVVFCYDTIPEELARRAIITPNLQVAGGRDAILGGLRADWMQPDDSPPQIWQDGLLALRDFRNLAAYLARSATRATQSDASVHEFRPIIAAEADIGLDDAADD